MSKCNCFADTLKLVTDSLKAQLPKEEAETLKVEWSGATFVFGENSIESRMAIPISYEYQKFKNSGDPHKNKTKATTSLLMGFCPLCGCSLTTEQPE